MVTAGSLSLATAAQAAPAQVAAKAPVVTLASSSDTFQDVVINPKSTIAYLTVPSKNQGNWSGAGHRPGVIRTGPDCGAAFAGCG
jgi:hypothetical protein